ncbi:MAG: hypothetical protein IKH28_06425 [Lachnospiraceae bacterium]|nr:hypothetical protein [Lachnospiraceae bacterium]
MPEFIAFLKFPWVSGSGKAIKQAKKLGFIAFVKFLWADQSERSKEKAEANKKITTREGEE